MNELLPIDNANAATIFSEGGLDKLLADIHREAESHVPDIETDKGRKAIGSIAAKVAKSKVYLDGLGKDLVSGWKSQAKIVDNERKKMRDDLDELKVKIRKPLTDYEDAEDARINAITVAITDMAELASIAKAEWLGMSLAEIKESYSTVREIFKQAEFDERAEYAAEVYDSAKTTIINAMDMREQYDKDQAELAQLHEEREIQQQKDRDAAIARKAAENATQEAERKAQDAITEAENKAAQDKVIYERKIQQEKDAAARAIKQEQDRVAAKELQEKQSAEAREKNVKHRKEINNMAVASLMTAGLSTTDAKAAITAIAKNKVPNVKISY